MTAPDLPAFLLARLAEDEAVALAAIEDDGGSDEGFSGQYDAMVRAPSGIGIAQGGFGEPAARLVATFAHPARVLADVKATRRLVTMHGPSDERNRWCDYCKGTEHAEFPCETVRILAQPYADHPDFDPSWRL